MTLQNGSTAEEGGAIYTEGRLTVKNSTFSNNTATQRGGAISNRGRLTVKSSTFNGNRSPGVGYTGLGGAIKGWHEGNTTVVNSTFYDNSARYGGAIHHNDTLTVTNSTFVGNTVTEIGPAIRTAISGHLQLRNSLLSGNNGLFACAPNHATLIWQSVNNYIDDGTCMATFSSDDGPINLGARTGSPAYYPLLAGSVAIDAANENRCPPPIKRAQPGPLAMAAISALTNRPRCQPRRRRQRPIR